MRNTRDARARHRERHTPSGFDFALADGVECLDPRAWDELTQGASVFLSRGFLATIARHGPGNLRSRCALVYRDGKPLAAVAAQALDVRADRAVKTGSKRALALAHVDARLLVCGNLLSWDQHGVAFARGTDPRELWPAVAEALYRIRRADKLFGESDLFLIKDLPQEDLDAARVLERHSYRAFETEPNMRLDLSRWRRFDDYLGALSSSYARAVRKTAASVEAAGCRCEPLDDLAPHAERLHALYLAVHGAQKLRPFTLGPEFLPAIARRFQGDLRVSVIRRGEQIVAFVSTLRDGDTAIGWFLGFDKDVAAEVPLYLRLLHACVADALALGCRSLSLGRTALEPKARLGARPQALSVFTRHRTSALNLLVRALVSGVTHAEAPERDPFKAG